MNLIPSWLRDASEGANLSHSHIPEKSVSLSGSQVRKPTLTCPQTHQKRAQEDEGNEVEVSKFIATLGSQDARVLITRLPTEAGKHDVVPSLPGGTPENREGASGTWAPSPGH